MLDVKDFIGEGFVSCVVINPQTKKERTFKIVELDAGIAEKLFIGFSKDNQQKNKGLRSKIVAEGVLNDAGDEKAFTFDEAQKLPLWLANALQDHIFQVNGLTEKTPDAEAEEKNA